MKKLFLLLLFPLSVLAHGSVAINSLPVSINAPGTYVLTRDFTFPSAEPLITIDTSGIPLTGPIIIDFQGHTVTAGPEPYNYECISLRNGIAVQPKQPPITIRNGTIVGFSAGIAVVRINATITNMVFKGNADGIILSESAPSTVSNCVFDGNGSSLSPLNMAGIDDLGERNLNAGANTLTSNSFRNIAYPVYLFRPVDLTTPVLLRHFQD